MKKSLRIAIFRPSSEGSDGVLIAYGPVLINEALNAQKHLEQDKINIPAFNSPSLNYFDKNY